MTEIWLKFPEDNKLKFVKFIKISYLDQISFDSGKIADQANKNIFFKIVSWNISICHENHYLGSMQERNHRFAPTDHLKFIVLLYDQDDLPSLPLFLASAPFWENN